QWLSLVRAEVASRRSAAAYAWRQRSENSRSAIQRAGRHQCGRSGAADRRRHDVPSRAHASLFGHQQDQSCPSRLGQRISDHAGRSRCAEALSVVGGREKGLGGDGEAPMSDTKTRSYRLDTKEKQTLARDGFVVRERAFLRDPIGWTRRKSRRSHATASSCANGRSRRENARPSRTIASSLAPNSWPPSATPNTSSEAICSNDM